jgi:hypothetical protein
LEGRYHSQILQFYSLHLSGRTDETSVEFEAGSPIEAHRFGRKVHLHTMLLISEKFARQKDRIAVK